MLSLLFIAAWHSTSAGLPTSGQWRNGFVLADVNRDGHADIVFGPPRKGARAPQIFLGREDATWTRSPPLGLPPHIYDYGAVAVLDLDGDGGRDLALAMHLTGLVALREVKPWTYALAAEGLPLRSRGDTFSARALRNIDWNGDRSPELVALSDMPGGGLVVFERRKEKWRVIARSGATTSLFGDELAVGDIDGDGRQDLLCASSAQGVRSIVQLNRGALASVTIETLPAIGFVRGVALADIDHDGLADPLVSVRFIDGGDYVTELRLLRARRAPFGVRFEETRLHRTETEVLALAAGDLDGDGFVDLVAGSDDGSVTWLRGNLLGFDPPSPVRGPTGCRVYHMEIDRRRVVIAEAGEDDTCTRGGGIVVMTKP